MAPFPQLSPCWPHLLTLALPRLQLRPLARVTPPILLQHAGPTKRSLCAQFGVGGHVKAASGEAAPARVAEEAGRDEEEKILRVEYVSVISGNFDVASQSIDEITWRSRVNNRKMNVTGLMSYDARLQQVWQIVEGRPEHVLPLWDRILQDSRHVVDEGTVVLETDTKRMFPQGWGLLLRQWGTDLV
mmetsp:Transcript_117518/g.293022  ORF Transcript_117518/g.293022 Transcript_117518/m.293022 type:complete len:187 (-) Transcript_117518:13-573(-)